MAGVYVVDGTFEEWCETKWTVYCDWNTVPCAVHISPSCIEQVRSALGNATNTAEKICYKIAATHYDELKNRYRTGQVAHALQEPLAGTWHILLYLEMLYLDDKEHPVSTQKRRDADSAT